MAALVNDATSMKAYEWGAEAERERIIALLEAEWWMRPSNKARLIALIKGDNR